MPTAPRHEAGWGPARLVVRARVSEIGGEVAVMSPRDTATYLDKEFAKWAKVVKDRNIKAD